MSPSLLVAILEKGLRALERQTKGRKASLELELKKGKKLSAANEEWLDNEANYVNERRLIDKLKKNPNVQLDTEEEAIVKNLREQAGDLPKKPSAQRKRKRAGSNQDATVAETNVSPQQSRNQAKQKAPRREHTTLAEKIMVLDWHNANGKNQSKTARHFENQFKGATIKQPLVSAWVNMEKTLRQRYQEEGGLAATSKRVTQTEHPQITEMLELWVSRAMSDGVFVTGQTLRLQWTKFADMLCIAEEDRLRLSDGWLASFKKRCGLKEWKRHGEAGSVSAEQVAAERERIKALLESKSYSPKDVFNMDETGFFYALPPDRGLADKARPGVKGRKVRLTYVFTVNVDGSEKLDPLIIGKSKQPRSFHKKTAAQMGFYYRYNAKAWMTTVIYQDWLTRWDQDLRFKNRHVLLLQDNFSGHVVPEGLTNIEVVNFAPNLTSHIQPLDQGIIRCFKAHYRKHYIERSIDRYTDGVAPAEIYDINQLEGMQIARTAWSEVDTHTIRKCWLKAKILPDNFPEHTRGSGTVEEPVRIPISALLNLSLDDSSNGVNDPLFSGITSDVEKEVERSLDVLQATGVLQKVNRMSLDNLLNPLNEQRTIDESTDQAIFDAVMEKSVEVEEELDGHGEGSSVTPPPSLKEVLQATTLLKRHCASLDTPMHRRVEIELSNLNRLTRLEQMAAAKETRLEQFFPVKSRST